MQPVTPTTTTRTAEAFRKPHPIRGILWGLIMGIGAAALAIILKIIPFELMWALIVLGGGILLGILWGTLGPAKKPKGDPPWRPAEQVTTRPDWDAGPVSPSPPLPPDVEPLLIQPLDVEPVDIEAVESDVPRQPAPEAFPDPVVPNGDPALDPPRTMDPPPPSDRSRTMDSPPPSDRSRTMDPPSPSDPPPPPPPGG